MITGSGEALDMLWVITSSTSGNQHGFPAEETNRFSKSRGQRDDPCFCINDRKDQKKKNDTGELFHEIKKAGMPKHTRF